MKPPELDQLELLADVDELMAQLAQWAEREVPWQPWRSCRALVRRAMSRLDALRIRLEAPLVVALFGGTGTGKSTLVNALVGSECSPTGRQRPTTTRPILIAHPDTELDALGLPLDDFHIVKPDAPLLRDIVLIDCPDPDTSETESPGSNLQRLHRLLPHCDVLIYTTTQQKYRSARVGEELGQAATGCRLVFVQTHADLDDDIRDDWRKQLEAHYDVPDMFFVDSLRALEEQRLGRRPTGDFGRLMDLLTMKLSASQRLQIRRANLLDLLHAVLERCRGRIDTQLPAVRELETKLEEQKRAMQVALAERLREELLVSRNLWERRLLAAVSRMWGFSPFSSILRLYNGLGNVIASMSLYRARNSAQMVLVGTVQGLRWLAGRQRAQQAESRLQRAMTLGPDETQLHEAQIVTAGYVQSAQLDSDLLERQSLADLKDEAARMEEEFLDDAGRRIDQTIDELAKAKAGLFARIRYETLFLLYVGYVLYRVGENFFYGSMFAGEEILSIDFYIPAAVFFVLWSGLLVMAFTLRLRRGLKRRVAALAAELAQARVSRGPFPQLEEACRAVRQSAERLDALASRTAELRHRLALAPLGLGFRTDVPEEQPSLAPTS